MATRDQIAADVRSNLEDAGVTFYSAADVNDAIQDAYDDVAVMSGCIQKSATLNFTSLLSYYDFSTLIPDYFAAVAIYNNNSRRWMHPDSRRSFDKVAFDWEIRTGEPMFWSPIDSKRIAIMPRFVVATGNMTVHYRAQADVLAGSDTPEIHIEMDSLLQQYATADLLDQAQEFIKADVWWQKYFTALMEYKLRIGRLALSDYLPTLQMR